MRARLTQLTEDFVVGWETIFGGRFLAENHISVDFNIEDAAFTLNQLSFDAGRVFDGSRQTGGLGSKISHQAKGDFDLHVFSSSSSGTGCSFDPRMSHLSYLRSFPDWQESTTTITP